MGLTTVAGARSAIASLIQTYTTMVRSVFLQLFPQLFLISPSNSRQCPMEYLYSLLDSLCLRAPTTLSLHRQALSSYGCVLYGCGSFCVPAAQGRWSPGCLWEVRDAHSSVLLFPSGGSTMRCGLVAQENCVCCNTLP